MTTIPPNILPPEPAAPLARPPRTPNLPRPPTRRARSPSKPIPIRCSCQGRRGAERGVQVFGYVGDAALEWDLALSRVAGDDVCFCADDVEDYAFPQLPPQLRKPASHLLEAAGIGDGVADDARIRASIIQSRNRPEPFLARGIPEL
ncbi:hypothetical protein V500_10524 [Pseudogymnoascus sp. VKM F-4518 (FW-2643)]|nr:hypothetical protein V500_10524 [Pseudogymnoascus sp. VKM F-4518 (FW-2643)]